MFIQKFLIFHRAKIAKAVLLSLLIPALFFCLPQTTATAIVEGNTLAKWSNEYSKYNAGNEFSTIEASLYLGYIQGFIDLVLFFVEGAKNGVANETLLRISRSPLYNSSDEVPFSGVNLTQLLTIVQKHLNDNPDKWNGLAVLLVMDALFPDAQPAK